MESTIVAVIAAAVAVVGAATAVGTAVFNWRAQSHAIKRDQVAMERDRAATEGDRARIYFDSYEKRIANLKRVCAEVQGSSDEETRKRNLRDVREAYDQTLEAWQQTQQLATLVAPGAIAAGAPKLPDAEMERIRNLLAGSARLPASLLGAGDYSIRGNAYYDAGEYPQALEAYNRALELEPDHPDTLMNRGVTLGRMGRFEEALKDFNRALELRPDHPDTLYNRGLTLHNMGRYAEALKDYNRALQLRPKHPATVYNRACTYSLMGRFEETLRGLEAAIKGDEENRKLARTDEDFEKLRNDPQYGPRFRELVGE